MWPDLFGPGWIWGVLTAAGLFLIFLALIWACVEFAPSRGAMDPIGEIWHQYEQGALTRQEFARAKQAWRVQSAPVTSIQSSPGARAAVPEVLSGKAS